MNQLYDQSLVILNTNKLSILATLLNQIRIFNYIIVFINKDTAELLASEELIALRKLISLDADVVFVFEDVVNYQAKKNIDWILGHDRLVDSIPLTKGFAMIYSPNFKYKDLSFRNVTEFFQIENILNTYRSDVSDCLVLDFNYGKMVYDIDFSQKKIVYATNLGNFYRRNFRNKKYSIINLERI